MTLADIPLLDLPPLVRHVAPPARVDPFAHARAIAAEAGAGTLVWAPAPDVLALAVVLEPDAPLPDARRAFFVGMAALGDALASACAPEREILFDWPDGVFYDAARLGGARIAFAPGDEGVVPDWAVFGVELIRARPGLPEAGLKPQSTSLMEEGFDPDDVIVESFARYLMLYADHWTHSGFGPIVESYLNRLRGAGREARIGRDGDLTAPGKPRRALLTGLEACAWRDPVRGGPLL
jgi:biotin-(acetyl-CoA carboxylase) ligase